MEQHVRLPRAARFGTLAVGLSLTLAACGGGSATLSPRIVPLSTAIARGCVYPSTSAVTTALPTAGGVGGTIGVAAVAQASAACSAVTVATGADATLTPSTARLSTNAADRRTVQAASQLPTPLAQISLTNEYNGTLPWTTLTLTVPTISLPPGVYPATISAPLEDGQIFTQNYTITIDASGNSTLHGSLAGGSLVTLGAGATGVLSIYPAGTVLTSPTPTATPSPNPSATATATPTATPAPTATPSPAPSHAPTPAPTTSPTPVSTTASVSISPNACIDAGSNGATINYTATVSGGPTLPNGTIYEYGWGQTAEEPAYGLTVPPPSANYGNTNIIVGPADTATVTVPSFGQFGLVGESGGVVVYLFTNGAGLLQYVEQPDGSKVVAYDVVEAGTVTCASQGL
jgi:hypothetical protein